MSATSQKEKLYCYVDETGQDTMGGLFIVSVVLVSTARDSLVVRMEETEARTGKGRVKWMASRHAARLDYMRTVLSTPAFKGSLYFSTFQRSTKYMAMTVLSTAKAILSVAPEHGDTTVYVDGLPKSRLRWFGTELRRLSVRTSKVSGVRREEADPMMRLADALAGFVRLALSGRDPTATEMFEQAVKRGYVKEV